MVMHAHAEVEITQAHTHTHTSNTGSSDDIVRVAITVMYIHSFPSQTPASLTAI